MILFAEWSLKYEIRDEIGELLETTLVSYSFDTRANC
jgi:hypothetical protein